MEKSWQLSVNVAFFMMGFVLFQFVFNSFLEVALRILETGRKKKEKRKKTWRILAYGLCSAKEA